MKTGLIIFGVIAVLVIVVIVIFAGGSVRRTPIPISDRLHNIVDCSFHSMTRHYAHGWDVWGNPLTTDYLTYEAPMPLRIESTTPVANFLHQTHTAISGSNVVWVDIIDDQYNTVLGTYPLEYDSRYGDYRFHGWITDYDGAIIETELRVTSNKVYLTYTDDVPYQPITEEFFEWNFNGLC